MPPKTAEKPEKAEKSEKSSASSTAVAEARNGESKVTAAQQRSLDAAIGEITKAYGDGSIMRLGSAQALRQIEVIPTGALAIDLALGVGGVPRGRVV